MALALNAPPAGKSRTVLLNSDALTIATVSELLHARMGLNYSPITLPDWVWKTMIRIARPLSRSRMVFTPLQVAFWRVLLMAEHVTWCQGRRIERVLNNWKPRPFQDGIRDVLEHASIAEETMSDGEAVLE